MFRLVPSKPWFLLGVGLLVGVVLGGFLPNAPLHAVATDRGETCAICTAPLDEEVEAIYFLDFLTGDLKAAALSPQTGKFTALYQTNVLQALGGDATKAPKYLITSGMIDIRRGSGRARFSKGVVYVTDQNTGRVAVFAIPWQREAVNAGQRVAAQMLYLDGWQCRTAAVRPGTE
jgi:hypothetical protein